jgi:light-regulated signal transduction histidine kinase (bacteriophytochrome)
MISEPLDILIVDDSPEDREAYRRFLSQADGQFAITEAETGAEGLDAFRSQPPDCILLDYNLPDLNGIEFLAQLADQETSHRAAVVMLTGQGNEAIAVEAMKKGAQDYLLKGNISAAELDRAVHNAIEKVSLMRAVEQQRRELARSNRELEQFAYAASHDLQAPLRRTQGFCDLLQRRYQGKLDKDADEFIHYIVDSVRHMQMLVNDLLNFSRAGTQQINLKPTAFDGIARRAIENLDAAIRECGGQVNVDPLPTVPADHTQMVQLLQNLIGNAVKYHGEAPPVVHVSADQQDGHVRFSVRDNGIGIAEEYAEEIFKIFKRLHSDSEFPGTGIGLATCQKIVERHGGKIWVESQPGQGSVFFFTIPTAAAAEQ